MLKSISAYHHNLILISWMSRVGYVMRKLYVFQFIENSKS